MVEFSIGYGIARLVGRGRIWVDGKQARSGEGGSDEYSYKFFVTCEIRIDSKCDPM